MGKLSSTKSKKNGGVPSRMGYKFHEAIEDIKDKRLKKGMDRGRISTEKVTNLIIKHNSWKGVSDDIIEADEAEVEKYG